MFGQIGRILLLAGLCTVVLSCGRSRESDEIRIRDRAGNVRVRLYVDDKNAARLTMYDQTEAIALNLGVDKDAAPSIALKNRDGGGIMITTTHSGQVIMFMDRAGEQRLRILSDPASSEVFLVSPRKKTVYISSLETGEAGMVIIDQDKQYRAGITLGARNNPVIGIYDKDGQAIWKTP